MCWGQPARACRGRPRHAVHSTQHARRCVPTSQPPPSQPIVFWLLQDLKAAAQLSTSRDTCCTATTELPACIVVRRERALRKDGSEKEEAPREERDRRRERSRWAGLGVEWLGEERLDGGWRGCPFALSSGQNGCRVVVGWSGAGAPCSLQPLSPAAGPLGPAVAVAST